MSTGVGRNSLASSQFTLGSRRRGYNTLTTVPSRRGIGQVRAPQIGSAPQVSSGGIRSLPQVRATNVKPYRIRATNVNMDNVHYGRVRDVDFDPYSARGISGVQQVSGYRLDSPGDVEAQSVVMPASVLAGQVDAAQGGVSALQEEMNRQALRDMGMGGRIGGDELRDVEQSTRQSFADRGMGRSSGALFAEALNRDRYQRERQNERRAFAQSVEQLDQAQRFQDANLRQSAGLANQDAGLRASLANQEMGLRSGLANQDADLRAALANQGTDLQVGMANQDADLRAALANQQVDFNTRAFNAGASNEAGMFNARGGFEAALANQGMDANRAATMYDGGLRAALANQQTRLAAASANQGAFMQSRLANQQSQLLAQQSNRDASLRRQMSNQDAGLRAALANQGAVLNTRFANQDAGLRAALANQSTALGQYGIDRNIGQQQWAWNANSRENDRIYQRNMSDLLRSLSFYS